MLTHWSYVFLAITLKNPAIFVEEGVGVGGREKGWGFWSDDGGLEDLERVPSERLLGFKKRLGPLHSSYTSWRRLWRLVANNIYLISRILKI